jgi:hypothetical protein
MIKTKNRPNNQNEILSEQKRVSDLIESGIPLGDMGTYEQWLMYGTKHEKEITNHVGIMCGDW